MGRKDKKMPSSGASPSIGAELRRARQEKGLSLTEMAKRLGYTKGYLSGAENGSRQPSEELIRSYERELDFKLDKLEGLSPTRLTVRSIPNRRYFSEPFPLYWNIAYQRNP